VITEVGGRAGPGNNGSVDGGLRVGVRWPPDMDPVDKLCEQARALAEADATLESALPQLLHLAALDRQAVEDAIGRITQAEETWVNDQCAKRAVHLLMQTLAVLR
jgi:hypothetical protein